MWFTYWQTHTKWYNVVMDIQEIIKEYTVNNCTLRMIAEKYNTNHHRIKRILLDNNIEITTKGRKRKPFTDEHRAKNDLSQTEWNTIKKNIQEYLIWT